MSVVCWNEVSRVNPDHLLKSFLFSRSINLILLVLKILFSYLLCFLCLFILIQSGSHLIRDTLKLDHIITKLPNSQTFGSLSINFENFTVSLPNNHHPHPHQHHYHYHCVIEEYFRNLILFSPYL